MKQLILDLKSHTHVSLKLAATLLNFANSSAHLVSIFINGGFREGFKKKKFENFFHFLAAKTQLNKS